MGLGGFRVQGLGFRVKGVGFDSYLMLRGRLFAFDVFHGAQ